jgi:hypothetical protein
MAGMSPGELSSEDSELAAEVESAFDTTKFAEVRITVRLPGELFDNGEPQIFGYTQLLTPEQVRIRNPHEMLPAEIKRAMRNLIMSMRFR